MGGRVLQLLRLEALYDKAVALGNEVLAARSRGLKIWHVRCEVGRFRRSREPGLWGFLAALVNRRVSTISVGRWRGADWARCRCPQ